MTAQLLAGDLTIDVDLASPGAIRLDWRGSSTARHPDAVVSAFLSEWAARASQTDARLELHFEALERLNSSTIAVLVQFLQRMREVKVTVALRYSGRLRWQQVTFEALRVFETPTGWLSVESVGD